MKRFLIIAIMGLAVSCAKTKQAAGTKIKSKAKETCGDFDAFLQKFSTDSIFQKQHVDFPVIEYYSDEDFPLDIMELSIDEENYEFIDLAKDKAAAKKEKDPYTVKIEKVKDSVFYRQHGINNYIDVTYKFARKHNCWWLVEVRDMTD